jgi:ribosome-associated translation inhibitor RaiA
VIQIKVQAKGFDLTAHVRGFVETQVLAALARFDARIELVDVRLEAVRGHATPDKAVCSLIVTLHPRGEVRSIASHARMNVAVDRAAADAASQVERELRRGRHAAAPTVDHRPHERPLELVLDGNRISQWQREMLERPDNYLRPVVIRERWAHGDEDEHAAPHHTSVRRDGPTRDGRRWSRPLTRVS